MNRDEIISTLQQIKTLADECLEDLRKSAKVKRATNKPAAPSRGPKPPSIDFDKPLRPFIKQYAKGMSGSKKFVLLLSRLAKGDMNQEVTLKEIGKHWSKMKSKSLLGMNFNTFYPAEARDKDWVELKKKGVYCLRPSWRDILKP